MPKIIVPGNTAYVTAAEVCTYNGWDNTDTVLVAQINALIPVVTELIEEYCNTSPIFAPNTSVTMYYSGNSTRFLVLSTYLQNFTSVSYTEDKGVTYKEFQDVYMYPTIATRGSALALKIPDSSEEFFYPGINNIKIVGAVGILNTSIPTMFKFAMSMMVKHIFDMRIMNTALRKEIGSNRQVEANLDAIVIPNTIKIILDKYKIQNTWQ
jgi:hypothetical protein